MGGGETCYKTGKVCSFDDDFNTIAPAILEADALVFTMPVYWYSIPSQIKGVIDRIYSLVVGGKDISGKECALIACCEEEDRSVLDGVRVPMERTAALNKWKMVGEILVPGVLNAGDIAKTDDGCKGCFGGHSSRECPCVQKDDMALIYPAVKESDVVVLASPLYYWTMSGQLRTALDRLFALEEGDGNLLRGNGKASALLMAAGGHGFEDAVLYFDHLMEHLRWKNLGHVLAGGNMDVGDIAGKKELDDARELGSSI